MMFENREYSSTEHSLTNKALTACAITVAAMLLLESKGEAMPLFKTSASGAEGLAEAGTIAPSVVLKETNVLKDIAIGIRPPANMAGPFTNIPQWLTDLNGMTVEGAKISASGTELDMTMMMNGKGWGACAKGLDPTSAVLRSHPGAMLGHKLAEFSPYDVLGGRVSIQESAMGRPFKMTVERLDHQLLSFGLDPKRFAVQTFNY